MEDVLRSCCAGLDIHQKVIVACVIRSIDGKNARKSFLLASIPLLVGCSNYLIGWCPMTSHISVWKVLESIGNVSGGFYRTILSYNWPILVRSKISRERKPI